MIRADRRAVLIGATALALAGPALAGPTKPEIFMDFEGRAIKGYDPVAYFLERKPVKGSEDFAYEWKGALWLFSSAENRDRFISDPDRWAPQYGGYCAWGVAKDRAVGIDPKIFRIFDDKLYLNLNMKVHKDWLGKHGAYIARANEKWPGVLVLAN